MQFDEINTFRDIYPLMAGSYSDRVAYRWVNEGGTVETRTYEEFCRDIRRGIRFLSDCVGNPAGTHIAILSRNCYDYVVMLFACLLSGAVVVPLNTEKSLEELSYELDYAEIQVLIHDGEFLSDTPELCNRFRGKMLHLNEYSTYDPSGVPSPIDPEQMCMILFTSGTTGKSKGVVLNQRAILSVVRDDIGLSDNAQRGIGEAPDAHISEILILPLYHVAGLNRILVRAVGGNTINLSRPLSFYQDVSAMPSDYILTVPVIIKAIHKDIMAGRKSRLGGLKTIVSAGAVLDGAQISDIACNGYFVMNCYGMTELFSGGTRNFSQDSRYCDSIGRACSLYECRIIDGELCFRGKGMMTGYYRDAEATAETIDADGWLHTGDLARIENDGYVYLCGRKKNLIILDSGENINPEELEAMLLQNRDIIETIVREKAGRIVAQVYCVGDRQESIRAYIRELNQTVPLYKHIAEVEFFDAPFERTSTGKIKR